MIFSRFREWFIKRHPILGSHIRRMGFLRTFAGGLPMFTIIPFLIITHYTVSIALYQLFIRPIFKTPILDWRDYIIIDRNRIVELSWFDKLSCNFCGYANGIATMLNVELDHINDSKTIIVGLKSLFLLIALLLYTPFLIFYEINIQIIYNVFVSIPLGMHRVSIIQAKNVIDKEKFAHQYTGYTKLWIIIFKNQMLRFSMCLEQIESAFCPLHHFEKRKGVVYPKHHENFLGPNELLKIRQILITDGSLSDRKPKF